MQIMLNTTRRTTKYKKLPTNNLTSSFEKKKKSSHQLFQTKKKNIKTIRQRIMGIKDCDKVGATYKTEYSDKI